MIEWQMENLGAWTEPETTDRTSAGVFRSNWTSTMRLLSDEIELLGGRRAVLEVVVLDGFIRRDGMLSARAHVGHPGVVVSFESRHGPLRYSTDQYEQRYASDLASWQANVRAVALGLGALRAVDRYGITGRAQQYTGWKALPAGTGQIASGMTATAAQSILLRAAGVAEDQIRGDRWPADLLREVYKTAKAATHPDRNNGDQGQWNLVDNAAQTLKRAGWLT
ncbi:MAG: hypothetical protein JWM93_3996 [Frankiales bacterium]|nr:hypothetical protein [Frankiales bacterium]